MKSQIFNTFLIVLVAQSPVAFAEPQPMRVVDDVVPTVTSSLGTLLGTVIVAVGDVTDLGRVPHVLTEGWSGEHGLEDGLLSEDIQRLLGNYEFIDGLLDDDGLVGRLLSAVRELLNNLLGGFDSEITDITTNASNTLNSSSGIWNDTLAIVPLVIEKAVEDAHQLAANIMDTLNSSIFDAIGNKLTLASSIIDALNTLNNIADVFVIPDTIVKLLVAVTTVTCSVFNSVLNVLVKIPNIPDGVTGSIENTCSVLNQTVFDVMDPKEDITDPGLAPLTAIAPLLLNNLKSIVTATGVSDLIGTNPDISTIKIPLTSTIIGLLSTLATNLNAANSILQQGIQTLTNTSNEVPEIVNNAVNVIFSLIPNTNCSNNIESSKAIIKDGSISSTTECINTAITSLQGIMNQYTSIINDINNSTSTGFLKATSLDSYIKMVANSGAVMFNTHFRVASCLAHVCGLAITEFVKLTVDSIHCLVSPA